MVKQLDREIEKLRKRLLKLSALVEQRVRLAVKALEDRDEELARRVVQGDVEISTHVESTRPPHPF